MQRQPNEMNTENPTTDDNEISAQKLCAGMMSIDETRHAGREGFYMHHLEDVHRLAMLQCFGCDLLQCKNEMIHDFAKRRRNF